ncbi:MAG: DNA-binding protein [Thermoproteota archaeon]|nr:DNA-binding protein [Candidatus Brockarchaeota archaeon]
MSSEAVVIVGRKKPWNYVTACITVFNSGSKTLIIRGRGENISRAVDVANLLQRNIAGARIIDVRILEESISGSSRMVPVIEIVVENPHLKENKR